MGADGQSHFEMKAHNQTYSGFLSLLKVGTVISALLAAIVVALIAS